MLTTCFYHSHKKRIVWKHGPNRPFCVLMLRTKLYYNPFLFTEDQNVNKPKSRAARIVYGPIFLPFYKIIVSFFSFFCQDASKTRSNCAIIDWNLSKKHKLILHKIQNGEPNYVASEIINFSLIFARSYLYKNLGTGIQIQLSWLVGWCIYCVTLRLHDIKKLQCPLNTPWKCILLITFLVKVLPAPFYYSLGIFIFCYTFY